MAVNIPAEVDSVHFYGPTELNINPVAETANQLVRNLHVEADAASQREGNELHIHGGAVLNINLGADAEGQKARNEMHFHFYFYGKTVVNINVGADPAAALALLQAVFANLPQPEGED